MSLFWVVCVLLCVYVVVMCVLVGVVSVVREYGVCVYACWSVCVSVDACG